MEKEQSNRELVLGGSTYVYGLLKNKYTIFLEGFVSGTPLLIAYFPYGIAMSLIAQEAQLSFPQYFFFFNSSYAGNSQFLALGMYSAGVGLTTIFISALFCNIRYFLMTSSMDEMTLGWSRWKKALIYYFVTDENYALLNNKFQNKGRALSFPYCLGMICMTSFAVIVASVSGHLLEDYLQNFKYLGFNYVIAAVFISMLAFSIKNKKLLFIALFSGIITILCKKFGLGSFAAIFSTLIICLSFAYIDTLLEKKSQGATFLGEENNE